MDPDDWHKHGESLCGRRNRVDARGREDPHVSQILGILKATAQPLPGGTFEWVDDCGFGVITPEACLKEAGRVTARLDAKKRFEGHVS